MVVMIIGPEARGSGIEPVGRGVERHMEGNVRNEEGNSVAEGDRLLPPSDVKEIKGMGSCTEVQITG